MVAHEIPRLAVCGLRGGSGKTLLTLGLISAWRSRGSDVIPFKKGPDYIDAAWMSLAAGKTCRNLDTFLMEKDQALRSFLRSSLPTAVSILEGNRGLYDGMDAGGTHSTAELARLLKCPLLLIIDCTKSTRTLAALVHGCQTFEENLSLAGVVLNRIGGPRHEQLVRETIEKATGVPVLGAIPRLQGSRFLERHLGLVPTAEHPDADSALELARKAVESNVDLDSVMEAARKAPPLEAGDCPPPPERVGESVRIGVIRDSAFNFYYPENLERLEKQGAEVVILDALHDAGLPPLDALYIGGGFPETHASLLSANRAMRESIRCEGERGLPIYAECGGLTYLCRSILVEGTEFPMVGLFPLRFEIAPRPQGHGYNIMQVDEANPFFEVGTTIHGHEFRYSRALDYIPGEIKTAYEVLRGKGLDGKRGGLCYKNILAAFCHIHALGTPQWAEAMVNRALDFKRARKNNQT